MKKPILILSPSWPITININTHPTPIANFTMPSILHVSLPQRLSNQWSIATMCLPRHLLIWPVVLTQFSVMAKKKSLRIG